MHPRHLLYFLALLAFTARAADVRFFGLSKGAYHLQTSPAAPVLAPGNSYEFHAWVDLNVPGTLASASLKWPGFQNPPTKTLTNYTTHWERRESWPNFNNLNAAAPNGTYTMTLEGSGIGTKTSTLTISADFYPPAPHLANFASAQEIDWRNPFTLQWQANSAEFTQVRITEGEAVVFETGQYPGAPNALPARASSVVIPALTLSEGRVYNARITAWTRASSDATTIPGAIGWAAYKRTTDVILRTMFANNDVIWYGVRKTQRLIQTSPAPPVLALDHPYEARAFAEASKPGGLAAATAIFPSGPRVFLALGTTWSWSERFPSFQAMEAAVPAGNCEFTLQTLGNGLRSATLPLTGNAWPPAPRLSNWYEANRITANQPFTLRWDPLPGASAADFLQVRVTANGSVLFETAAHPKAAGALNGLATSVTLPAGILPPGGTAEASILYFRPNHTDSFSYPRTPGVAGYASETQALLRARGGAFNPPRFSAIQRQGGHILAGIAQADPGRVYTIQQSAGLRAWTSVLQTNAPASEFSVLLNAPPPGGKAFLRLLAY